MNADHSYEGTGAEDGKYLIVCTMGTEWWIGGNESFVRGTQTWDGG